MNDMSHIFAILFLMLGPFKLLAPYTTITKGAESKLARRIALLAILYSSIALLLAAVLGEKILMNYGIPIPILAISGGIILFLVALQNVIQQFSPPEKHDENTDPPSLKMAVYPLAFPSIVTPYGIAAVIVFLTLSPDLESRLAIGGIIIGIMVLNLIFMLVNRYISKFFAVILPVLGAVLSIVQVALGLNIIYKSLLEILNV